MSNKKQRLRRKRKVRSPKAILFDKVWDKCSEYVRRLAGGQCYTCEDKKLWKYQDAGHFRHGKTKLTHFNIKQIRCQCSRCNRMLSGNLSIFGFKLTKELGVKEAEQIINDSYKEKYYKMAELEVLDEYFTNKLNELNLQATEDR